MDFFFNVRFDTWEAYSAFCAHAESFFQKPAAAKTQKPEPTTDSARPVTAEIAPQAAKALKPKGYTPSKALVNKVNELIALKQPFKAVDAAPAAIKNGNYKAKVNRWLQAHPELTASHLKTQGKGKGALVYTPIENGKAVLPPGEKPVKTDWPIKGAVYRPSYHPQQELTEDDAMDADLLATLEPSGNQAAS